MSSTSPQPSPIDDISTSPPPSTGTNQATQYQARTEDEVPAGTSAYNNWVPASPHGQYLLAFFLPQSVAELAVEDPSHMSPLSPTSPLTIPDQHIASSREADAININSVLHRLQQDSVINSERINDGEALQNILSPRDEQDISLSTNNELAGEVPMSDASHAATVDQAVECPRDEFTDSSSSSGS